jgi:hypothetical protein
MLASAMLAPLCLLLLCSCAMSWQWGIRPLTSSTRHPKLRDSDAKKTVIAVCVATFGLFSCSPNYMPFTQAVADETVETVVEAVPSIKQSVPKLTAADVLKSDLDPRVDFLNDVLFVFKLYPDYLEKGDYSSIRSSLRSDPTVELRKTCKKLVKYLPVEKAKLFNTAYASMIDVLNDVDAVRTLELGMLFGV